MQTVYLVQFISPPIEVGDFLHSLVKKRLLLNYLSCNSTFKNEVITKQKDCLLMFFILQWNQKQEENDLEIEEDKKQWHPAFCAAMELEFKEDNDVLDYEREHNLSKKPLQIDLLIIKKEAGRKLKNEIGDFFLEYNLMEYKSPGDGLTIDDLYKVLGYACFYKSETGGLDEVKDTNITISLVREEKPAKLLKQLSEKYEVKEEGKGIYRVKELLFPLQILVTGQLDPVLHGWLHSLTRTIEQESAENLLNNYSGLEDERDKQNAGVIVDFVSNVNVEIFLKILKESARMTEEMKILIAPEIVDLRLTIENNKKELASRDKELANKDAEIERLKRQLQEAQQQK